MVDEKEARAAAERALAGSASGDELELVGEPEATARCLVFYWTCPSGETPAPGVGPIAVGRRTGRAYFLGSQPLDVALAAAGLA